MQDLDPLAKNHYYLRSLRENKEALQKHSLPDLGLLTSAMRKLLAAEDEMPDEPFGKMVADTRRDIMQSSHVRSARLEALERKLGTIAKLPTVRACLEACRNHVGEVDAEAMLSCLSSKKAGVSTVIRVREYLKTGSAEAHTVQLLQQIAARTNGLDRQLTPIEASLKMFSPPAVVYMLQNVKHGMLNQFICPQLPELKAAIAVECEKERVELSTWDSSLRDYYRANSKRMLEKYVAEWLDNLRCARSGAKLDIVKAMTEPIRESIWVVSIKDECMRESRLPRFFSCIKSIDSSTQLLPSIETGGLEAVKLLLPPNFPFTKIRGGALAHEQLVVGHNSNEDHITKDFITFILSNNWCSNNYGQNYGQSETSGNKVSRWIWLCEGSADSVDRLVIQPMIAREKWLHDRVIASYLSTSSDEWLSSRQTALEHMRISPQAREFVVQPWAGLGATSLRSQALTEIHAAVKAERDSLKGWGAATRKWWVAASAEQRNALRCAHLVRDDHWSSWRFHQKYHNLSSKAEFDKILRSIDCKELKAAQVKEMRELWGV